MNMIQMSTYYINQSPPQILAQTCAIWVKWSATQSMMINNNNSSLEVGRLMFVDNVDVKGEIESQRVAIRRRQWFGIGSVRLEVEVLLRHEHDHVDGQQPAHNDVVVLSAGKVPVDAPLVQLAAHEVDPRIFVFIRSRLRGSAPQKLVVSPAEMGRPILAITSAVKPLPFRDRVVYVHLTHLVVVVHRIVLFPVGAHVTHGKFVILEWLQMLVIERCLDRLWWRERCLCRASLKISSGYELQNASLASHGQQ